MENTSVTQFRALLERQQLLNQRQHKRLARRIHDEISQKLTLMALQLSLASEYKQPATWEQNCREWADVVVDLGHSVREIINELQPRILNESGLVPALQWFAQSTGEDIRCTFRMPKEDIVLTPLIANELFGICREIVTEILLPHHVPCVDLELEQFDGLLRLQIKAGDDVGASARITESGLDSLSIHERMLCLDGTAELSWVPDAGSVVTLSLPVHESMACAQAMG